MTVNTPFPERHECADWESDDEGVLEGYMHYEDGITYLEYEWHDVNLDLHVDKGAKISLIAGDDSTDDWRSISVDFDADAAELLAEQLKLAAQVARDGKTADIRL